MKRHRAAYNDVTEPPLSRGVDRTLWQAIMNRFSGEPSLEDVLSDPIIEVMMKADGIDRRAVCAVLVKAGARDTMGDRDQTNAPQPPHHPH